MVRVRGAIARLALGTTATWGHDGAGPLRERCPTGREGSRSSRGAKRHPGQNRRRARPYPASSVLVLSRCVTWGSRPRRVARDGFRAVTASRVPLRPTLLEPSSLERSPWFRKVDFTFWSGAVATRSTLVERCWLVLFQS